MALTDYHKKNQTREIDTPINHRFQVCTDFKFPVSFSSRRNHRPAEMMMKFYVKNTNRKANQIKSKKGQKNRFKKVSQEQESISRTIRSSIDASTVFDLSITFTAIVAPSCVSDHAWYTVVDVRFRLRRVKQLSRDGS